MTKTITRFSADRTDRFDREDSALQFDESIKPIWMLATISGLQNDWATNGRRHKAPEGKPRSVPQRQITETLYNSIFRRRVESTPLRYDLSFVKLVRLHPSRTLVSLHSVEPHSPAEVSGPRDAIGRSYKILIFYHY